MEDRSLFAIQAALQWAKRDIKSRSVSITVKANPVAPIGTNHTEKNIEIWCYDYSKMSGIYVWLYWLDPSDPAGSIDKAIDQSQERKEREMLAKLKQKYGGGF